MSQKRFPLFRLALGFVLTGSAAQATFVTFIINPANLNERALVAEQIYLVPGGYDYEFLVANTGTVGINGFFGGIGMAVRRRFQPAGRKSHSRGLRRM